jgi:hypothetical protein
MTQNPTSQTLPPEDEVTRKQSTEQDNLRALQEGTLDTNKAVQESMKAQYPNWPTSKPGPRSTLPPPGMKPMNAMRSEQVKELGYNQETGEPGAESPLRSMPDDSLKGSTSFDQLETAQESLKKRKERL